MAHPFILCYDGCLSPGLSNTVQILKAQLTLSVPLGTDRINIFIVTVLAKLITRLITLAISDHGPLRLILPL